MRTALPLHSKLRYAPNGSPSRSPVEGVRLRSALLSYGATAFILASLRAKAGGRSWIRTSVGRSPADLQSALVGHLSILPNKERGTSLLPRATARIFCSENRNLTSPPQPPSPIPRSFVLRDLRHRSIHRRCPFARAIPARSRVSSIHRKGSAPSGRPDQ
jgi:hypothetical protein